MWKPSLMGIEAMFEVSAQPFLTQQSEVTMARFWRTVFRSRCLERGPAQTVMAAGTDS
jgi:hypothetical protein